MERREFIGLSTAAMASAFGARPSVLQAATMVSDASKANPEKRLNPNTQWLRQAKWGFFTHYLAHTASTKVKDEMNGQIWNKKVNSFQVKKLGQQLSDIQAPYFFITIAQGGGYFCSPNKTHEKFFGFSDGRLSQRDLVAELAAELVPRGIKMCVYLPAYGKKDSAGRQKQWQEIITEWSDRWGKSISAWWIDGGVFPNPEMYKEYTNAFKSGNPDALIAYNTGPIGWNPEPKKPATNYEDYLAGEVNWRLPVSGIRPWDKKEYYVGPDILGDQLHFLTFLGSFWGMGQPRFPDELVVGWTKHINNHGGTISWDVPLSDSGIIPENHVKQLKMLSKKLENVT
jgi:hypothetical protein